VLIDGNIKKIYFLFILLYSYLGSFPLTLLLASPLRIIGSIINNTRNETVLICLRLLLLLSYLYVCVYAVFPCTKETKEIREKKGYTNGIIIVTIFFSCYSIVLLCKGKKGECLFHVVQL